jgi:hypothetical protein
MSNEELALAIRQGDQGRTLELWEQVNGLVKRKALQIVTVLQLSGNPRGVEFDGKRPLKPGRWPMRSIRRGGYCSAGSPVAEKPISAPP